MRLLVRYSSCTSTAARSDTCLGSPNGLGAGYFLLQHKRQLGGANFIDKITIFRNDGDEFDDEPNIIFHVDKKTPPMPEPNDTPGAPEKLPENLAEKGSAVVREGKAMKRSRDGKDLIREHVVWAKL